jgi:hypothetical protein
MDKDHIVKTSQTYEVKFAIGSREGYHGPSFTEEDVLLAIAAYQEISPLAMPVKVSSDITFINKDYREKGFEVSGISYPNSKNDPSQVDKFMDGLAEHLLYCLKQNRITIRKLGYGCDMTVMLERKDAEKTHKK